MDERLVSSASEASGAVELAADVPRNPGISYESSDVRLAPLAWIALALFSLLVLAPWIAVIGFRSTRVDVARQLVQQPPAPRLQTDPPRDLREYFMREHALLSSYGWVDRAHGIARVPIDVAMQRALREGLPGFASEAVPGEASAFPGKTRDASVGVRR